MKVFILACLLLAITANAFQVKNNNTFQANVGITDECQKEVNIVADKIVGIIYTFIDGFNFETFMKDVLGVIEGGYKMNQVCEGEMWEAVVDLVLQSLADGLHDCAGKVILCIEDAANFIELWIHGKPSAFVITKHIAKLSKDIDAAVNKCKESKEDKNEISLQAAPEQFEECAELLIPFVPKILDFVNGKQTNVFAIMAELPSIREKCLKQ